MIYTADFETTTTPDDCRVWAWGLCEIANDYSVRFGKTISEMMEYLSRCSNTIYFHNLKFDGEFLFYYLFQNGYKYVKVTRNLPEDTEFEVGSLKEKQFTTLISDKGQWYEIKICISKYKKKSIFLTVRDSLKVLPFTVEQIAKAFKLEIKKGKIDYNKFRPVGYEMDQNEREYLHNDVSIVAQALDVLFSKDLTKMTTGANAVKHFKEIFNPKRFERLFPQLDYQTDKDIRYSYRGGFTYLMPKYRGKIISSGIVLDVNSLYPSVMYNEPMPYDYPVFFNGEYILDPVYPLYVVMITCTFELKKDHIPTIQLKLKDNPILGGLEYISSSKGMDVTMCLTSVDLKLFLDHYDVYNIEYHSGWKFKAATGLFCEYIDYWTRQKIEAKENKNGGLYTLAKLMLNSLYGKFSTGLECRSKIPTYDGTLIKLELDIPEMRKALYIPVGTFITSYARNTTIRAAQKVYSRFIYADTDSLHLIGTDIPEDLEIDPAALGKWKHETTFSKAKFLRPKTYIEFGHDPDSNDPDQMKITAAGLPAACHDQVTFKNFTIGKTYHGKLKPSHYPGGIVLEDIDFTLSSKLTYFNN